MQFLPQGAPSRPAGLQVIFDLLHLSRSFINQGLPLFNDRNPFAIQPGDLFGQVLSVFEGCGCNFGLSFACNCRVLKPAR